MAVKYLYKANPKVAAAVGATAFDHYTWPDGTFLLWGPDLQKIDRTRYFLDHAEFCADLGVVPMTDGQAAAEQRNPSITLPEARLPEYRWQPENAENTENTEEEDSSDGDFSPEEEEDGIAEDTGEPEETDAEDTEGGEGLDA